MQHITTVIYTLVHTIVGKKKLRNSELFFYIYLMKHIKRYKVFEGVDTFNIDDAMSSIRNAYSQDAVESAFDNEVINWVDDDWSDDFDSEYDWYIDHNNGEAQDVVIDDIIKWYKSQDINLDVMDEIELIDAIKQEYSCLFY